MHVSKPLATIVAGLCTIALVACSGDDADPLATVTDPPTTTATIPPTTTSAPTTTSPPTTPPPTQPPTTPPPATTVADVEAQIQADLTAGRQRLRELQMHPTLDGLAEQMATIALPGSEYFQQQVDYINELVSVGDVLKYGEPVVDALTVEAVTFEGTEPYTAASVKVCDAANIGRVTPPENSPVGEEIISIDSTLLAVRYSMHVVRADANWVIDVGPPRTVEAGYPGQATCAGS